jgi:hypothetical protein
MDWRVEVIENFSRERAPFSAAARECLRDERNDGFTAGTLGDACFRILGEQGPRWSLLRLPSPPEEPENDEMASNRVPAKIPNEALHERRYFFPADVARDTLRILDKAKRERAFRCRSPEKHALFHSDPETVFSSDVVWVASRYGKHVSTDCNALARVEAVESFLEERPDVCVCELVSESRDNFERIVSPVWTEDSLDDLDQVRQELRENFLPGWNFSHHGWPEKYDFCKPDVGLRAHLLHIRESMISVSTPTGSGTCDGMLLPSTRHYKLDRLADHLTDVLNNVGSSDAHIVLSTFDLDSDEPVELAFPLVPNQDSIAELTRSIHEAWLPKPSPDNLYSWAGLIEPRCQCGQPRFWRKSLLEPGHRGTLLTRLHYPEKFEIGRRALPFVVAGPENVRFLPSDSRLVSPEEIRTRVAESVCALNLLDSTDTFLKLFRTSLLDSARTAIVKSGSLEEARKLVPPELLDHLRHFSLPGASSEDCVDSKSQ